MRNKGFTLIELLVVIAIIAILAGLSIFALQGARRQGRDARRMADLETIRSALELYRADCNSYIPGASFPAENTSLTGAACTPSNPTNVYLQSRPGDPAGRLYAYQRPTNATYCLWASLEDPQALPAHCNNPPCNISTANCGAGFTCNYCVVNP